MCHSPLPRLGVERHGRDRHGGRQVHVLVRFQGIICAAEQPHDGAGLLALSAMGEEVAGKTYHMRQPVRLRSRTKQHSLFLQGKLLPGLHR